MNDLEMINTLRSDVPPAGPAALAGARAALLERAAAEASRKRWRMPLPKPVLVGAALAAVVGAVVVAVPRDGSTTARSVFAQAAQSAASAQAAAQRYVYVETATYLGEAGAERVERWIPTDDHDLGRVVGADGVSKQVQFAVTPSCGSQFVASPTSTPPPVTSCRMPLIDPSYGYLSSLPTDTAGLRQVVYDQAEQLGGVIDLPQTVSAYLTAYPPDDAVGYSTDQGAYALVADVVATGAMPQRTLAAFLRVEATIPGVSVEHDVVDAAGRPGIGLRRSTGAGDWTELVLDENSHQVLGVQSMLKGARTAVVLWARHYTPTDTA